MKNKNLLKTFGIMLLVVFVLTWVIPSSATGETGFTLGAIVPTGFADIFSTLQIITQYFGGPLILIILIGMFYGVINKSGAYKALVDKVTTIFKGYKLLFIILTVLFYGATTALTGIYLPMFMFIPFSIAVLSELKYKKLSAILLTAGSVIVGLTGEISSSVFKSVSGVTDNTYLWVKVGLVVVLLALNVLYVIRMSKTTEKKSKNKVEEINDYMFIPEKRSVEGKNPKGLALFIVMVLTFIVFVLGLKVWSDNSVFTNAYTAIQSVKIGQFAIIDEILGSFETFGAWSLNSVYATLGLAIIILAVVNKLTIEETIEGAVEGAKKVFGVAILSALITVVVIFVLNSGFLATIVNLIAKSGNIALTTLSMLISTPFMVEESYAAQYLLQILYTISSDDAMLGMYSFIIQVTYGFTMLVAPSSILLMISLYYTGEGYSKWIKYIWKLLLVALVICLMAIVVATLL